MLALTHDPADIVSVGLQSSNIYGYYKADIVCMGLLWALYSPSTIQQPTNRLYGW